MATSKKRKIPGNRSSTRPKQQKKLFLPMDKATVGEISLQFHLALDVIRRGKGDRVSAHCMAQVVLIAGVLTRAGHGELTAEFLNDVEKQVSDLLDFGRETGEWTYPDSLVESLTIVVNEHDRQLRETRLQAVVTAMEVISKKLSQPGS